MNINNFTPLPFHELSTYKQGANFQPGQILMGKVLKLFPEGIAHVMIGQEQVTAKLEVPLSAGTNYWFQVAPGDDKVHLKLVPTNEQKGEQQQISYAGLLKSLNIPETKNNRELLQLFIKEGIPVTKESFTESNVLLQGVKDKNVGLGVLKEILTRNLPLTRDVFSSLLSTQDGEPMHATMKQLQTLLRQENILTGSKTTPPLLQILDELMATKVVNLGETVNQTNKIPKEQKTDEHNIFNKNISSNPVGEKETQKMLTIESEGQKAKPLLQHDHSPKTINMNDKQDSGKIVSEHIKGMISKLGLDHELKLMSLPKGQMLLEVTKLESLKSALIQFVQSEQAASQSSEIAEKLLHKITGIQLLSNENGPIQQIVMQIPFVFANKATDLTIQWCGRKKEDGTIDPSYCRILFYLELEHLNEVVVDMSIQNRVMNLKIINDEHNIKTLSAPFVDGLKENLHEMGYTLSTINYQSSNEQKHTIKSTKPNSLPHRSSYHGVDIRI